MIVRHENTIAFPVRSTVGMAFIPRPRVLTRAAENLLAVEQTCNPNSVVIMRSNWTLFFKCRESLMANSGFDGLLHSKTPEVYMDLIS
jgi:hypothetical protein